MLRRRRPWSRERPSSSRGWAIASALALVLVGGCPRADVDRAEGEGVVVRRVLARERPRVEGGVQAEPGDWVLESRLLRVLVGGTGRIEAQRGAILEAIDRRAARHEGIVLLAPSIHVAHRRHGVTVSGMRIVVRDRRPRLRIDGEVSLPSGTTLAYAREFALSSRHAGIGIASEAVPDRGRVTLRFGARIMWGGAVPWLPGVGEIADETWHAASFVGLDGQHTGTVYAMRGETLRAVAAFERHGDQRFLEQTEVMGTSRTSAPRAPAREQAFLVVAQRGMAEALRTAGWLDGQRARESYVHVPDAPADASVRIETARGEPVVRVRLDARGDAVVPLPPVVDRPADRFVAVATANGHAEGDPVPFLAGEHFVADVPRGGRVRITVRDAADGSALPARVRFIPESKPTKLDLGPVWSALGAGDTVIVTAGSAEVAVPEGRYRVLVTHGPEWTLHDETVEVSRTFRPDVRAELFHVIEPGDYVGCDLHVHAAPSPDSQVGLEDRVASLVAEGIGFAVPTDHNHVTDYGPAAALLGFDDGTFLTVPGVEATTYEPAFGHFNAYPVIPRLDAPNGGAPIYAGVDPATLFASMRALGPDVTIQVNHPRQEGSIGYFDLVGYDPRTGLAEGAYSDDYDVLEIWNGFDLARPSAFQQVFGDWLAMIARGRRVTGVGNSDSHQIRYQWAGYPRTYVRVPERTPHAILRAIREGRAFVTSGPFLEASVGEARPGGLAHLSRGRATLRVRVRTPPFMKVERMEIYVGAEKIREVVLRERVFPAHRGPGRSTVPVVRQYDATVELVVPRDAGLVVLVRGDHPLDDYFARNAIPPLAFTNPIWLDADGDGRGPVDPRDAPPQPERAGHDAGVTRR